MTRPGQSPLKQVSPLLTVICLEREIKGTKERHLHLRFNQAHHKADPAVQPRTRQLGQLRIRPVKWVVGLLGPHPLHLLTCSCQERFPGWSPCGLGLIFVTGQGMRRSSKMEKGISIQPWKVLDLHHREKFQGTSKRHKDLFRKARGLFQESSLGAGSTQREKEHGGPQCSGSFGISRVTSSS